MAIEVEFKNYRCFLASSPARFVLADGFTAFVGPNNSGKSALLRFFFELRLAFDGLSRNPDQVRLALRNRTPTFQWPVTIKDYFESFSRGTSDPMTISLQVAHQQGAGRHGQPLVRAVELRVHRRTGGWLYLDMRLPEVQESWNKWENSNLDVGDEVLKAEGTPVADCAVVFQMFRDLASTIYIPAFRNAVNTGAQEGYFDIQVGTAFVKQWGSLQSGSDIANRQRAQEVEEAVKRIFSLERFAATPNPDDTTLILNVDGDTYRLDELGSGITHVFLAVANAAIRSPSYILIDEPELGLHPSLQRDFLTVLGQFGSKGTVFATHSYGLARTIGDLVYTTRLTRRTSEIRPLENTPRLSEFVGEMSFSAYRELGFQKLLLVEGPNEVKTVQQFLRWLHKDHQVVMIPLGGSSMINGQRELELEELKRITDTISALIDSEKEKADSPLAPNRRDFVEACRKAGISVHVLERRAIENYFTDTAVKSVLGDEYSALGPYDRLEGAAKPWGKSQNWRIAQRMDARDLDGTDLGEFLDNL